MKRRKSLTILATVACVLMLALSASAASVNCSGVAAWSPNSVSYATGALVTYNGSEYKCIQAHTSEVGWDPADVPALWSLVGTCSSGGATPTPTAKPTATATGKPTATPTGKPTATPTAKPTATATGGGGGGGKLFAPYVDTSLSADENLSGVASSAGLKGITLAFLTAGGCSLGWGGLGGTLPSDSLPNGDTISNQVSKLKGEGVTVIVSIGGADGVDAAAYCSSASALQGVYQQVVSQYGLTRLDFDIEGAAQDFNSWSQLRDQALIGLKKSNPGLIVSYTLPVLASGLTADGMSPLNQAKADGFQPNIINVMAMDYGTGGVEMGTAAESAASATESQVSGLGWNASIGITPMIGQNDSSGEIFTLSDASNVTSWANSHSYVSLLAFWSLGRDNGGCAGQGSASPSCSGVSQSTYQFSSIFKSF